MSVTWLDQLQKEAEAHLKSDINARQASDLEAHTERLRVAALIDKLLEDNDFPRAKEPRSLAIMERSGLTTKLNLPAKVLLALVEADERFKAPVGFFQKVMKDIASKFPVIDVDGRGTLEPFKLPRSFRA